jgi:hypothetical protein
MTVTKTFCLVVYYLISRWLPTQPMPGYKVGYFLRRVLVRHIVEECGEGAIIKCNAYIGKRAGIGIGARSQVGHNSHIGIASSLATSS